MVSVDSEDTTHLLVYLTLCINHVERGNFCMIDLLNFSVQLLPPLSQRSLSLIEPAVFLSHTILCCFCAAVTKPLICGNGIPPVCYVVVIE